MKKVSIFKNLNKPLLILTIVYMFLGALLILDASSISATLTYGMSSPYYFFKRQLFAIAGALAGSLLILKIPTKAYKGISLIGSVIFIILLFIAFGSNLVRYGINEVKLDLPIISIQPAEFLKVLLLMYMSTFYGTWANANHNSWSFFIPLILCGISVGIIGLGGDYGSAAIMLALFALVFIAVPNNKNEKLIKWIKGLAIGGMILCILFLKFGYKIIPEEKLQGRWSRLNYVNPCDRYEEDSGYQVCNGYIAINNGGLFGAGVGNSVQKYLYLPASHTDFIFPIIVEELGIIVSVIIIIGYIVIAYYVFKIASNCYKLQNSLICYGIGIYFILHIFVNLCGVLGIIPLTGVPLPFLSYGGSFCTVTIGAFAVVQRINIENMYEREQREIKKVVNS